MTDYEEPLARKVHTILLSLRPESGYREFASTVELLSLEQTTVRQSDDFRAEAFFAVRSVTKAIFEGACYSERNRLLFHAVNSAHSWLNARRFLDTD
jgi:hypothetical protein